jgi:two-component system sensor histidine kinase KdpD
VPGVGLGLAICRAIIETHGGHIRAANRDMGGASFTFTLPLEPPPPPLETDEESDTGIGFPRNGSWAAQNSPNALI